MHIPGKAALLFVFLALLAHVCGGETDAPSRADWPLFRGTPARLGCDGVSALPDQPPVVAWVFADGRTNFPVTFWSSPLVRAERVYVGGGVLSPFGTRGSIYCLAAGEADAGTAKPRVIWKHNVETLVFSSPSLASGIVVCGEGTHTDTGARLYALEAGTDRPAGRRIWDFRVEGTVEASPCIADGMVYFGTGDDFHCLDLGTGRPRWKATIVDVLSSPVVAGGLVFVGSGRSAQARPEHRELQGRQLCALDAHTGDVRWQRQLSYACNSPITYADGRLVAGTGTGTFIVAGGRSAGEVVCHDAATGRQLWSCPLPDNVLAAIPVTNGLVHAACRNGTYYLLALSDGHVLWEFACGQALLASPVVSGDRALLVSCTGMAHCLDFKRRTELWRLDLAQAANRSRTSEVFSSPVLAAGRIYVGLGRLGLICLRPR